MIDADDLALLAQGFAAAMVPPTDATLDPMATLVSLYELGWGDLLAAAPHQGAATTFTLLGSLGASAPLLDDILAVALGLPIEPGTCVIFPAPHSAEPPGRILDGRLTIDGLASSRIDATPSAVVAARSDNGVTLHTVDAVALRTIEDGALKSSTYGSLDPQATVRKVRATIPADLGNRAIRPEAWDEAVRDARLALAGQLIGGSRQMLELARAHAIDRVQFGRPIASFQTVRHRLAEALVAVEAAAGAAEAAVEILVRRSTPPEIEHTPTAADASLAAAVAKSLAGKAARVTAMHAQQVLAGIGFTADHSFHRFMKRAMIIDTLFGSARTLPVEIGHTILARRTAPRLVEL